MSPRAAWRLETLGFREVYDYVAGKADWTAAGLATEGRDPQRDRAGAVSSSAVLTCPPNAILRDVAERLRAAARETVVVINAERVVLGRLRLGRFAEDSSEPAYTAMEEGPTTVRASEPLEALLARMRSRDTPEVIVTTPEGELLGTFSLEATR